MTLQLVQKILQTESSLSGESCDSQGLLKQFSNILCRSWRKRQWQMPGICDPLSDRRGLGLWGGRPSWVCNGALREERWTWVSCISPEPDFVQVDRPWVVADPPKSFLQSLKCDVASVSVCPEFQSFLGILPVEGSDLPWEVGRFPAPSGGRGSSQSWQKRTISFDWPVSALFC